jgi:hypothetical protein
MTGRALSRQPLTRAGPPTPARRARRAAHTIRSAPTASSMNGCGASVKRHARAAKAVYTTVTLFASTFIVAMNPGLFQPTTLFWQVTEILLFTIGIRHLYTSLKEHFDHYTYRPPRISVTRPVRRSNKRYKRSAAWAFVIIGYLTSVAAGILIGLLTDSFSAHPTIVDAFLYALIYPPIAVLIVDMMYLINSRFDIS